MKVFKADELIISKLKQSCKHDIFSIVTSILFLPTILIVSYAIYIFGTHYFEVQTSSLSITDLTSLMLNEASASDKFLIICALLLDLIILIDTVRTLIIKNTIIENLSQENLQLFSDKITFINAVNIKDEDSISYIEIPIEEIIKAECVNTTETHGGKAVFFIKNLFRDPLISNKYILKTLKIISKRGIFYLSVEESNYLVNRITELIDNLNTTSHYNTTKHFF